jgi:hypothetical protein
MKRPVFYAIVIYQVSQTHDQQCNTFCHKAERRRKLLDCFHTVISYFVLYSIIIPTNTHNFKDLILQITVRS